MEVRAELFSERTALVLTADGEMAVALRERLDRAYVTVREVRPGEIAPALDACRPWPWMLAGSALLPAHEVTALSGLPSMILWQGTLPEGMPGHALEFDRFTDLAAAAQRALRAEVGGLRLAIGSGVVGSDGVHRDSAEVEALVTHHPTPVRLPPRRLSAARRLLGRWQVGLEVSSSAAGAVLRPSENFRAVAAARGVGLPG